MSREKWHVDQAVLIEYRYGKTQSGVVTKIGRTLVTVKGPRGEEQYRMDTGKINDSYGGVFIRTVEEMAERAARSVADRRLIEFGARFDAALLARLSVEQKHAIVDIIEGKH